MVAGSQSPIGGNLVFLFSFLIFLGIFAGKIFAGKIFAGKSQHYFLHIPHFCHIIITAVNGFGKCLLFVIETTSHFCDLQFKIIALRIMFSEITVFGWF